MRHPRRPGLSLTEVLVAMFVMALGLMALLTLFPLGAMQIGQALKDDRTAQTAAHADSWLRVWWRDAVAPFANNPNALPNDQVLNAMDDPNLLARTPQTATVSRNTYARGNYSLPINLTVPNSPVGTRLSANDLTFDTAPDTTGLPALPPDGTTQTRYAQRGSRLAVPSYPVLVDPLGWTARLSALPFEQNWVGHNSVGGGIGGVYGTAPATTPAILPRRCPTVVSNSTQAYAAAALTDDMTFQANGGAGNGTEPLGRQGRYHWAALIQRPNNSKPDETNLTVLVFDGRPPFLGIQGDEAVLTGSFVGISSTLPTDPAARSLTLNVPTRGADQPQLARRGGWVLLASMANGVRQVTFHRVTGLTTTGDDLQIQQYSGGPNVSVTPMALDVEPPLPKSITDNPVVLAGTQVYLLAGLSEVFEKPLLTR